MNPRKIGIPKDVVSFLGHGSIWWDYELDLERPFMMGQGSPEQFNRYSPAYRILQGGHVTIVQGPIRHHTTITDDGEERYFKDADQNQEEVLIIQSLLDTVQLASIPWAYLHCDKKSGCYRLTPGKRPSLSKWRSNMPVWLPLVPEEDLDLIRFFGFCNVHAEWNGREVEVTIGWEDAAYEEVVRATRFLYEARRLDITFEPLAHVTREGNIVGIVVEKHRGRTLEYRDLSLVYEAFTRMQANNLYMQLDMDAEEPPRPYMFVVCDRKFRIMTDCLPSFHRFDERAQVASNHKIEDCEEPERHCLYHDPEIYHFFDAIKRDGSPHFITNLEDPPILLGHREYPDMPFHDYAEMLVLRYFRKRYKTDKFKLTPWKVGAVEFGPGAEEEMALARSRSRKAKNKRLGKVDEEGAQSKRSKFLLVASVDEREIEGSGFIEEVGENSDDTERAESQRKGSHKENEGGRTSTKT
ncbi:hypothetical protein D9757_007386 [Collybiopsis confluens]|uniref:Uncharacterized protein n=1 Tax=Collybiopsis confluens TaxID=2823264 RepID=A0A8H5HIK8_9AGAR|nr:hypothetical protein D9757_007386 [Collybiopsis confluens]